MSSTASCWRRSSPLVAAVVGLALSAAPGAVRAVDAPVSQDAGAGPVSGTDVDGPVSRESDAGVVTRGADEPLGAFAQRLLPPDTRLVTDPVEVELPPLGRIGVILFREEDSTVYTGWALVPEQGAARTFRKVVLPPPPFTDGLFGVEVKSVFAATVGSGPGRDLCVLYEWYRFGTGTEDGHDSEVYRWTGSAFERRAGVERAVAGLTTAGKVREKLKRWRPPATRR